MKPPVPQKEANNLPAVISTVLPSPPRGAADTAAARAVADVCCFCADRRFSMLLLESPRDENSEDGA